MNGECNRLQIMKSSSNLQQLKFDGKEKDMGAVVKIFDFFFPSHFETFYHYTHISAL